MSWYSDKEPYDEGFELPICKTCMRGFTTEECAKCTRDYFSEVEDDLEEEEG